MISPARKISSAMSRTRGFAAATVVALLAACAAPPPKPAPPPPQPVAQIPARPIPPRGASKIMSIPYKGADGVRQTVNAYVTPAQATWNLRSAYNVGALNCLDPRHAAILEGYKAFLKTHKRGLARTNAAVESEWRNREGTGYARARDSYSTRVYNYFALPPTLPSFCDAIVEISRESLTVAPTDLDSFSARSLVRLEGEFDRFFQELERYQQDVLAWDTKYGALYDAALVSLGASPGDISGGGVARAQTNSAN